MMNNMQITSAQYVAEPMSGSNTSIQATIDGISEMDGSSSSLTIGSFVHTGINSSLRLGLGGSGRIDGQVYRYHWTADAEL